MYMYIHTCVYMYIHIYIERERCLLIVMNDNPLVSWGEVPQEFFIGAPLWM